MYKYIKKIPTLTEANHRDFMSAREKALQKELIKNLKDDGKGHKHARYAERLADFDIKIVYYNENDPETLDFTAAISFDDGVIYISEGFLNVDPADKKSREKMFAQLNVLLRHEMAHNLMMHQIRMMHKIVSKYSQKGYTHIKMSQSLHDLMNIIEDFEISNERYSVEDKEIVRHMILNGKEIGGLVTEDHRNWDKLKVIDMYDELCEELEQQNQEILDMFRSGDEQSLKFKAMTNDVLGRQYLTLYSYADTDGRSKLGCDPVKFLHKKGLSKLAEPMREVITNTINDCSASNYTMDELNKLMETIATSVPTTAVELVSPRAGNIITTIYTPEEKTFVVEILKAFRDRLTAKEDWRNAVKAAYTNEDFDKDGAKQILAALEKKLAERNN